MAIEKLTKDALEELLEQITQLSDGSCPFCSAEDFPVNGELSGYDEVEPEDAEEYQIEHDPDCLILDLEKAHSKIK